ncbi:hypothetical protein [Tolypothrix sp. NIES-4075]|nr:hypothetical protein [Tolypothrix sp. NIES-4075]
MGIISCPATKSPIWLKSDRTSLVAKTFLCEIGDGNEERSLFIIKY